MTDIVVGDQPVIVRCQDDALRVAWLNAQVAFVRVNQCAGYAPRRGLGAPLLTVELEHREWASRPEGGAEPRQQQRPRMRVVLVEVDKRTEQCLQVVTRCGLLWHCQWEHSLQAPKRDGGLCFKRPAVRGDTHRTVIIGAEVNPYT